MTCNMKWIFGWWIVIEITLNWCWIKYGMIGWSNEANPRIKWCTNYDFLSHKFHQEPCPDKLGFCDVGDVFRWFKGLGYEQTLDFRGPQWHGQGSRWTITCTIQRGSSTRAEVLGWPDESLCVFNRTHHLIMAWRVSEMSWMILQAYGKLKDED